MKQRTDLFTRLKKFFSATRQMSWTKHEVLRTLQEIYIEYLEEALAEQHDAELGKLSEDDLETTLGIRNYDPTGESRVDPGSGLVSALGLGLGIDVEAPTAAEDPVDRL